MRLTTLLLLLAVSAIGHVQASGEAQYATCVACHGANAEGNQALSAPRLAHLKPVYIVAQLEKFKSGIRGGADDSPSAQQMAGMAGTLADEAAMMAVATYIATLTPPPAVDTISGDVARGADYYNQFCGACHGAGADGNPALNSPRLVGADDWYLQQQLQAFRSGTRGTHPEDKTGRQMRAMAGLLPDDQTVADVVAFINSLK